MLTRVWRQLKVWRGLPLGPVTFLYRFDRSTRVTRGAHYRRSTYDLPPVIEASRFPQSRISKQIESAQRTRRPPIALVVGVGPGFGFSLARRLAAEGFDLILACRNAGNLTPLLQQVHGLGVSVEAYGVDATDESGIAQLFTHIEKHHGCPSLVVYSLQYFSPGAASSVEVPAFEAAWRHNCLGAFLIGRQAARLMKERGEGTILFVGSTSSIIGRADHLNLAVGKFGQRALAQVMARELWPLGIHVAHVIIDADILEDGAPSEEEAHSSPDDIAQSILHLHRQPKSAWTSELDLRPWNERFWEHC